MENIIFLCPTFDIGGPLCEKSDCEIPFEEEAGGLGFDPNLSKPVSVSLGSLEHFPNYGDYQHVGKRVSRIMGIGYVGDEGLKLD